MIPHCKATKMASDSRWPAEFVRLCLFYRQFETLRGKLISTRKSGMPGQKYSPGGSSRSSIPRRDVLRIGGLTGLGLTLPVLLEERAKAQTRYDTTFGQAKQVIVLYLHGGHPQQETFDPKPQGPSDVRGEFGAVPTNIPGIAFSELLPKTSRIADRLAIVRSMSHSNSNHVTASLPALTGHTHPPGTPLTDFPPSPSDFPPHGAVLNRVKPAASGSPTWVRIGPLMQRNNGTVLHGQTPGFLGAENGSFDVDQDLLPSDVKIAALKQPQGMTEMRMRARLDLLGQFESQRRAIDEAVAINEFRSRYDRAVSMLTSSKTRDAFDLASEPARIREAYGATEFGQRCLLARRLAEAGIPMINVSYCHTPRGSWDTHSQHFSQMKDSLAPTFDTAFSALILDLEQRGMLADTLVLVNAEFGRTPAINAKAGRDHWPFAYSLALAGAGIRPGTVYGASDNSAAYPVDHPHDPKDMAATLYHLLGVDPSTNILDRSDRPFQVVIGKPIAGILA